MQYYLLQLPVHNIHITVCMVLCIPLLLSHIIIGSLLRTVYSVDSCCCCCLLYISNAYTYTVKREPHCGFYDFLNCLTSLSSLISIFVVFSVCVSFFVIAAHLQFGMVFTICECIGDECMMCDKHKQLTPGVNTVEGVYESSINLSSVQ